MLLCGFDGEPPLILFNSWPRRWTTWRRAGPSVQPSTSSETSTSTKNSWKPLQLALRGTVRHCGASFPPSSPQSIHSHLDSSPTTPLISPQIPQHSAHTPKNCYKKKKNHYIFIRPSFSTVFWAHNWWADFIFYETFTFFIVGGGSEKKKNPTCRVCRGYFGGRESWCFGAYCGPGVRCGA